MTSCPDAKPGCGEYREKHGPPPKGWVQVKPSRGEPLWYCGPACAGRALGVATSTSPVHVRISDAESDDEDASPPPAIAELLRTLSRVSGQPITVMSATPARVEHALVVLVDRLMEWVDAQAVQDAKGRPTTAALLAEVAGDPVQRCSRCDVTKTLDAFPPSASGRRDGRWCRECLAARSSTAGEVAQGRLDETA
jgi:hypothetical protein